ncbi:hypothetical protein ACP6C2_29830 [Mycolicibacterium septicum]
MSSPTPPSSERRTARLVSMFLGDRLEDASEPPGLREAIIDRVALAADKIRKRGQTQIDHLRSPSSSRLPDAYLVDEEILENELQVCAAGIRTARALEGVFSDPHRFEYELAQCLASNAQWAMRCEASRVPRPSTRASVLDWSLNPIPWLKNEDEWPPSCAVALSGARQLNGPDGHPVRVAEAPYAGWVQLGMIERQESLASRYPKVPARELFVATGLEACEGSPPANSAPLYTGSPDLWAVPHDQFAPSVDAEEAEIVLRSAQGPLSALVDYTGQPGAPHLYRGVGLQRFTLVPQVEIVALLGLRPEIPALRQVLVDHNGPALVGRNWHGFLIHAGDYRPLEPAVQGADLLLRPDLYESLVRVVGTERLALGITVNHATHEPSDDAE